jgi:hypothetical protein
MTTETDIEEICRRLGWEYSIDPFERPVIRVPRREVYVDPENNADLHVRWMVEHGISVVQWGDGRWSAGVNCQVEVDRHDTPHEAIRAALLAKLRSEQDGIS